MHNGLGITPASYYQLTNMLLLNKNRGVHEPQEERVEYDILLGAAESFRRQKIDCVFISTHSNELHERCTEFLTSHGFRILASADSGETYSFDGLIAACAPHLTAIDPVPIFRKSACREAFMNSVSAAC